MESDEGAMVVEPASRAVALAGAPVADPIRTAGPSIAVGLVGGSALGLTIGALLVRLRRRLDGDGFGAVIELTFTAVLAATLVARSIGG